MSRKEKLFYVKTGLGCGIRAGFAGRQVVREELRYAGIHSGVQIVRKATPTDIAWVKAMGGHIPKI